MIMILAKNQNFLLLFTAIALYSFCPRFCTAQGNSLSSNPCETNGRCGEFGSCNSQDSPICTCLRGFNPQSNQEWESGNWTSGCVRRVPLNCERNNGTTNGGRQDGFFKLQQMKMSGYSDQWFVPQNQREGRCLRNCSCIAYGFNVSSACMFWYGTLIGIQRLPSGSGSDLYVRVANSELDRKKDSNSKKIIIIVAVIAIVIISICGYLSWKWMVKRRGQKRSERANTGSVDSSLQDALNQVNLEELPLFKMEILANATDNFSEANKLGKGGFGPVYKGVLANGREIAVKRLSKASG